MKNTADNPSCVEPVNNSVEKGVFLSSPVNADEGHKKSKNCPTLGNRFCLMGCHQREVGITAIPEEEGKQHAWTEPPQTIPKVLRST